MPLAPRCSSRLASITLPEDPVSVIAVPASTKRLPAMLLADALVSVRAEPSHVVSAKVSPCRVTPLAPFNASSVPSRATTAPWASRVPGSCGFTTSRPVSACQANSPASRMKASSFSRR